MTLNPTDGMLPANSHLADRYLILELIAIGGMGNVYRALDLEEDSFEIAIKVLHEAYRTDPDYLERFRREVKIATEINHPNVVKVFDYVELDQHVFFTMEFVHGISLEEKLTRQQYLEEQVARVVIEVADGLKAIHASKIVHRDLKPGNIMQQPDGASKIIDFGVSRPERSKLTQKNVRVGSMQYIPPEVWLGKKHTEQGDLYSFGCLLFEIWNQTVPFDSDNPIELMNMHCKAEVPMFHRPAPGWLESLILKLLAKDPQDRFSDCQQVIEYVRKNCVFSQSIQVFDQQMQKGTIRSGRSMISTFGTLDRSKSKKLKSDKGLNTYLFALRATRPNRLEGTFDRIAQVPRGKTIIFKLPRNAALVFEFELPSRDFLFLGVFLLSLNCFDWYLTAKGMQVHGLAAEGNSFLKSLMDRYGVDQTLLFTKVIAIIVVLVLTVLARKSKHVKDLVGVLSLIYLLAAVIPWIYILYYS